MLDAELKSKVNQLWEKFWSSGISNPLIAIEQMSYLIFMKRLEDEDSENEINARLKGEDFTSIFEGHEDYKWSNWINMSADDMLNHVKYKVFPFLASIGDEDSLYNRFMKEANFVIPTGSLLVEATNIVDDLKIKEQNKDVQGDLYEYLLSQLSTAGKNGQFRTPRHIIKMMVEILKPKLGEVICDPACGTAGFLMNAYNYILKENTSVDLIKVDEDDNEYNFTGDKLTSNDFNFLNNNSFYGFDFDPTMVRIGLMNLIMHGIKNPNIEQVNTLSLRFNQEPMYDLILANPPFTGSIDEEELNESFSINSKKTEILFLELMYNCLNIGGRCAVVVPQGILFGTSNAHKSIRRKLLENCRLDMVISMPSGVFKPYAGVATAILIFTKGESTEKVLFYDMESDGFTLDDKRDFIDGKGDIPDIIDKYNNVSELELKDRKSKTFFVPFDEIKENDYDLSISKYKEIEYEEIDYEEPEVIKEKILELEEKIITGLNELNF